LNKKTVVPSKKVFHVLSVVAIFFCLFACQSNHIEIKKLPTDRHQPYNYVGHKGMVVAAHPLAVQAGLEVLKKGGNAVDAAIATAFALNAAEPFASGIGGGGFMLIFLAKEKRVTVINYREKAPAHAYPSMFLDKGKVKDEWRKMHGRAVAVPGALAGWNYALKKYGTLNLAEAMKRSIQIAEQGFSVSETFSHINKDEYEKILLNSGESSPYLCEGLPYEPGDMFQNPDLAKTFRRIAAHGWQDFYNGDIAQRIVEAVQNKGGLMTKEDLSSYSPKEQFPLKGTYKEYSLYSIPPPGAGGLHTIQLLNIVEHWPVSSWGFDSPEYIHHMSEAFRFVFADRARYLGDPDFVSVPIQQLISKGYASQIASKISPHHLQDSYPPGPIDKNLVNKQNTTHLNVLDKWGNIVSLTQSINDFFGSGVVPSGTGFLLNNHMADFSPLPDSINAPRPYRRPVSNMAPLILFHKENPFLILGSPGGTRIFPSLTQIIINVIEFGMTLDEAIEAPRFFSYSTQGKARSLFVESRIPPKTIHSLEEIGHTVEIRDAFDKFFGGAQGIMILSGQKIILGGADSRRDGAGEGY
jgi:gamma-glutamyltranspeptidase/glutathione hydrolase